VFYTHTENTNKKVSPLTFQTEIQNNVNLLPLLKPAHFKGMIYYISRLGMTEVKSYNLLVANLTAHKIQ